MFLRCLTHDMFFISFNPSRFPCNWPTVIIASVPSFFLLVVYITFFVMLLQSICSHSLIAFVLGPRGVLVCLVSKVSVLLWIHLLDTLSSILSLCSITDFLLIWYLFRYSLPVVNTGLSFIHFTFGGGKTGPLVATILRHASRCQLF
jgi:hypothetical protein